jgi:hypothetical protein
MDCCWVTGTTLTGMESNCQSRVSKSGNGDRAVRDTYAEVLEKILSLVVNVQLSTLGVLSEVESRDLRHVLILALSLLFLQLEGDTTDRSTLNSLHQMGGVAGNLWQKSSAYQS